MHHPEPDELGLLQTGDHLEHARLLAPFQLGLESDEAVVIASQRVLSELHRGVREAARARIGEADGLHGSEAQRVLAAMRHHLDRQATLEELLFVEVVNGGGFRGRHRPIKRVVLLFGHRAVEIVAILAARAAARTRRVASQAPVPARGPKDLRHVDRLGEDDWTDRIVEVQVMFADKRGDVGRERIRSQRAGGHDHGRPAALSRRQSRHLFAHDRDQRMRRHARRDGVRKRDAIHGQRRARGHPRRIGGLHDHRAQPPHFFFQQPDGVIQLVAAKRVAAHELGQAVGFVHGRRTHGPHLVNADGNAETRSLPGSLAARKPSPDDVNHVSSKFKVQSAVISSKFKVS